MDEQITNTLSANATVSPWSGGLTEGLLQNTFREYLQEVTNNWAAQSHPQVIPVDPSNFVRYDDYNIYPTQNPQKRKRRKIAKIKSKVTEEEIAKAITKHTKEKAKFVNQQTEAMEGVIASEEMMISDKQRKIASAKNRMSFYKTQKERLKKTPKQIVREFQEVITTVKQMETIEDITLDSQGRIIVTTKPIQIKKEYWDEPKIAGRYQIRIDFSKPGIRWGVRALNITQLFQDYDSPTINRGYCCWGNAQKDIERDFFTQNIIELVTDMVDYISSPNEQHGFIGLHGDKDKGWEQFFLDAEPLAENYNWEVFERERESSEEENLPISVPNSILEPDIMDSHSEVRTRDDGGAVAQTVSSYTLERNIDTLRQELNWLRVVPRGDYEEELWTALGELGINHRFIGLYLALLLGEDGRVERLKLQRIDSGMFVLERDRIFGDRPQVIDTELSVAGLHLIPFVIQEMRRGIIFEVHLLHDGFLQRSTRSSRRPISIDSSQDTIQNIMQNIDIMENTVVRVPVTRRYAGRAEASQFNPNLGTAVLTQQLVSQAQDLVSRGNSFTQAEQQLTALTTQANVSSETLEI